MQYALIPPSNGEGNPVLLDIQEYLLLTDHRDAAVENEPVDEAAFDWVVAYGSLMCSPLHPEERWEEILDLKGCGFGRFVTKPAFGCRLSEMRDIEVYDPVQVGLSTHRPVAVLLGTTETLPSASTKTALTLFPRYDGQDVLTNILNRPFLLSLKKGHRLPASAHAQGDWRSGIDVDRVTKVASTCF